MNYLVLFLINFYCFLKVFEKFPQEKTYFLQEFTNETTQNKVNKMIIYFRNKMQEKKEKDQEKEKGKEN